MDTGSFDFPDLNHCWSLWHLTGTSPQITSSLQQFNTNQPTTCWWLTSLSVDAFLQASPNCPHIFQTERSNTLPLKSLQSISTAWQYTLLADADIEDTSTRAVSWWYAESSVVWVNGGVGKHHRGGHKAVGWDTCNTSWAVIHQVKRSARKKSHTKIC